MEIRFFNHFRPLRKNWQPNNWLPFLHPGRDKSRPPSASHCPIPKPLPSGKGLPAEAGYVAKLAVTAFLLPYSEKRFSVIIAFCINKSYLYAVTMLF